MIYGVPLRVNNVIKVKEKIETLLEEVNLDTTDVTFRKYSDLIAKIPSSGALTEEDLSNAMEKCININGEKI